MKVRCSLKLICKFCKFETKKGKLRVRCLLTGRHNQRKGFSSYEGYEGYDYTELCCTHNNIYNSESISHYIIEETNKLI